MPAYCGSLFDRLMHDPLPRERAARYSAQHYKDAIARDLEALLNTRLAYGLERLQPYPECGASVVSYGLLDFAGMSLASTDDRRSICQALVAAVRAHEPRLAGVTASLAAEHGVAGKLRFVIAATLQAPDGAHSVSFDALLEPSTLLYAIGEAQTVEA